MKNKINNYLFSVVKAIQKIEKTLLLLENVDGDGDRPEREEERESVKEERERRDIGGVEILALFGFS